MSTAPSRRDLFATMIAALLAMLGLRSPRAAAAPAGAGPATVPGPVTQSFSYDVIERTGPYSVTSTTYDVFGRMTSTRTVEYDQFGREIPVQSSSGTLDADFDDESEDDGDGDGPEPLE